MRGPEAAFDPDVAERHHSGLTLLRGACIHAAYITPRRISTDDHPKHCRCRECQRIRLLRARADHRLELFANR